MGMKEANGFDNDGNPIQYGLSGGNVTTNAKGMKPSERIRDIRNEMCKGETQWDFKAVLIMLNAIIQYLDEQHEAKGEV